MRTVNFQDNIENLNIIHIFEYYDHPLFYIAQNTNLDNYLFYFIDDEPYSTWFVSQVSMNEVNTIKHRQVGIKGFLKKLLKKERLFKVFINQGKLLEDQTLNITEDIVDWIDFPEDDFEVEFDYVTNTFLEKVEAVNLDEHKYLKLIFKDVHDSHSIPAPLFKNILSNLEEYISITTKHLNQKSKIPLLNLLALPASSFGAEFEVILEEEFDFEQIASKVVHSIVEFVGELETINPKELSDQIFVEERFTPTQVKAIQSITEIAIDSGYDLIIEAQNDQKEPINNSRITKNDKEKISVINTALGLKNNTNTEIVEIEAIIYSVNLKNNGFWLNIKDVEDKSKFEDKDYFNGKMKDELFNKLEDTTNPLTINVPSRIIAQIQIITKIDYTQKKSKDISYWLISFRNFEQSPSDE